MEVVLGLDTSCYTSSLALIDLKENLLLEKRIILDVPLGKRGLAQSEGVFQHVRNMPLLFSALKEHLLERKIVGIAASTKPRPLPNSYMPVFTVGAGQGQALADVLGVPFFSVSHQEGHLMAGLWSAGVKLKPPFLAIHISGGTTDLLLVRESQESFFSIQTLGSSLDIHAGQLVDRIGVALGLPFPAGKQLDLLASEGEKGKEFLASSVKGYNISLSGAETKALRLLEQGVRKADVALAVFQCLANSLEKVILKAMKEYQIADILLVGGVAANSYLRQRLVERLEHPAVRARLHFAQKEFSSDNAVGTALLGGQVL